MSTPRLLLCVGIGLVLVTGVVVYRDLTQMREQRDQAGALSRGEVPLDDVPAEPSPFLEDLPLAGAAEHALLVEGETDKPEFDILSGEAPPELPLAGQVEPVPLLTPEQRRENIAAIKEALPDISDERLEFWLEETRDLPPEMIHDMLMLRKHFGALTESFNSEQPPAPKSGKKPAAVVADPVRESLLKARALVLKNMLNEQSIGYLATKLVFVEEGHGVRLADSYLLTRLGDHRQTDRPLDISVRHHHTFLVVYKDGRPRLTRYGRLMVGPTHHLQLAIEETELIVAPEIVVPDGVTTVAVSATGEIVIPDEKPGPEGDRWKSLGQLELKTVPEPAYLQPVGSACFLPTRRSGEIMALPDSSETELLLPGTLQESNVDSQLEDRLLKQIDRWLQIRNEQKSTIQSTLIPFERPKSHGRMRLDIF
jgi:flagellar basal body rod protein FlgG